MMVGLLILLAAVIMAALSPQIAAKDPLTLDPFGRLQPPSSENYFGTDQFGRDVFARTIYGSRLSLVVGVSVSLISMSAGAAIGVISGYYKRVDDVVMRFMDGLMAFPSFLFAIALVATLGASLQNVIIAISVVETPGIVRIVRSSVLSIRERQFVEGGSSYWGNAETDTGPSHLSQPHRAASCARVVHIRCGNPGGGGPELPWCGSAAIHTELGQHDGRGQDIRAACGVDVVLPGNIHHRDGFRSELHWRWAA